MNAFEITINDVINVLTDYKIIDATELSKSIFANLDKHKIESSALYGNSLESQTKYAYEEIFTQAVSIIGAEEIAQAITNTFDIIFGDQAVIKIKEALPLIAVTHAAPVIGNAHRDLTSHLELLILKEPASVVLQILQSSIYPEIQQSKFYSSKN